MGVAHLVEEVFTVRGVAALAKGQSADHSHQHKANGKVLQTH